MLHWHDTEQDPLHHSDAHCIYCAHYKQFFAIVTPAIIPFVILVSWFIGLVSSQAAMVTKAADGYHTRAPPSFNINSLDITYYFQPILN